MTTAKKRLDSNFKHLAIISDKCFIFEGWFNKSELLKFKNMLDKTLPEDFANAILACHKYQLSFPTFITNVKNVIDALMFDGTLAAKDAPLFARYMLEYVQGGWTLSEETISGLSSHILELNAELEAPFDSKIIGSAIQAVNIKRGCSISSNGYTFVIKKMQAK